MVCCNVIYNRMRRESLSLRASILNVEDYDHLEEVKGNRPKLNYYQNHNTEV